jgi:hypothetical protein
MGLNVISAPPVPASAHHHDHAAGCCDHQHGHDHNHGVEGDAHDHGNGWLPIKCVLLLLPVALFFLNLPNGAFSASYSTVDRKAVNLGTPPEEKDGEKINYQVGFLELQKAFQNPDKREALEGQTVQLSGRYFGIAEDQFTLVRYKMNCCAADAIPLNAIIKIVPTPGQERLARLDEDKLKGQWVRVTGRVKFIQDGKAFRTAIFVKPTREKPLSSLVETGISEANPFATN